MGSRGKSAPITATETALLEAACLYSNLTEDLDSILADIDRNESVDHLNDQTRIEAIGHLLKALEAFSAKAYEDVDRHVHAAVQRLHEQEVQDLNDDKPRVDAKIRIAELRHRAVFNKERITDLIDTLHQPIVLKVHRGMAHA